MSTKRADAIGPSSAGSTRWRIDPSRSSVAFRAKGFWGIAPVKGGFTRYHGTLDLDAQPAIELTVEGDSLDTKNKRRDKHLRSPDFFDVETHPQLRFISVSAVLEGERLLVRGQLHARGASIPLSVEATLSRVDDELEIEAVAEADHHKLGMTWSPLGMIRVPSKLMISGRLVRDGG